MPHFLAFPDERYMALSLPNAMVPTDEQRRGATGLLVRFRSDDGFKAFMIAAMEAAALVWPGVAVMWDEPADTEKH